MVHSLILQLIAELQAGKPTGQAIYVRGTEARLTLAFNQVIDYCVQNNITYFITTNAVTDTPDEHNGQPNNYANCLVIKRCTPQNYAGPHYGPSLILRNNRIILLVEQIMLDDSDQSSEPNIIQA